MDMTLQYYDQFEYRAESWRAMKTKDLVAEMNKLGKEGWELINIVSTDVGNKMYLFKRKLVTYEG